MDMYGPECEIKQSLQVTPRNWIPKSANTVLIEVQETFTCMESTIDGKDSLIGLIDLHTRRKNLEENSENSLKSHITSPKRMKFTHLETYDKADEISKESENEENSRELLLKNKSSKDQWENIQEVVESDF